jgi:hypothetical protein
MTSDDAKRRALFVEYMLSEVRSTLAACAGPGYPARGQAVILALLQECGFLREPRTLRRDALALLQEWWPEDHE